MKPIYVLKSLIDKGRLEYCKECGGVVVAVFSGCVVLRSTRNFAQLEPDDQELRVPLPDFCQCDAEMKP